LSKQEKTRRIEELNHRLSALKEEKRKLDAEAEELAEKRNSLNEEFKRLKAEVQKLKSSRDEINAEVKELKRQRIQLKTEVAQKIKELKNLQSEIEALTAEKPSRSFNALQKEVEAIEWKIQTTPLSLQEEKKLVERVEQLEDQISVYRKMEQLSQKKLELTAELKALEARAKLLRERIIEKAEKSQKIHEEMLKKAEEARKLKSEADSVHKLFLQTKEKAKPLLEEIKKILEEIRKLKEEVQAEEEEERRKSEENLLEKIAKQAMDKLKRGEKLSWEEFKILTEKGTA
jgi:uncharacterized coiled-coil DUF342 family protein